jgi:putative methionine-R-sulfoxide reductase with GAF domain
MERDSTTPPAFAGRFTFAEKTHDPPARALEPDLPVPEALSREQMSPAERTHRHRASILEARSDVDVSRRAGAESFLGRAVTSVGQGEWDIVAACEEAVERLCEALPDPEVSCLVRDRELLRNVAHRSRLRLIFEIPHEQGGIAWRAVEHAEPQLVEDVRTDPDYLTSDPTIRSEVAVPVHVAGQVVAVLDLEFPEQVFAAHDVALVRAEADRLAAALSTYFS